jgi:hypothetical protein
VSLIKDKEELWNIDKNLLRSLFILTKLEEFIIIDIYLNIFLTPRREIKTKLKANLTKELINKPTQVLKNRALI